MKVQIKEETKKLEIKYPCLMKADELVVLFIGNNTGTVIVPNEYWEIGAYNNNWKISEFTPFQGEIILSNDYEDDDDQYDIY